MSLQDKLNAFKQNFESGGPPYNAPQSVHDTFHRATDELIASGQAERALKAGDRVTDFTLPDSDGNAVSSRELLAKGPLVITFYRGVWCPYCNIDLQAIEAAADEIRATGASLVSISQQTPANSRLSKRQNNVSFPILSDKGGEVAHTFGIRFVLPDYLQELYKAFGTNLPAINDEPSWTVAMPARYVIRQDGVIAYAEVSPDYTIRPDPSEMLPTLKGLQVTKTA